MSRQAMIEEAHQILDRLEVNSAKLFSDAFKEKHLINLIQMRVQVERDNAVIKQALRVRPEVIDHIPPYGFENCELPKWNYHMKPHPTCAVIKGTA